VEFSLRSSVLLVVGGGVGVGSSRQDKGWCRLQLVLQGRLVWRAAGQRRAVRAGRVDGLEIIFGEQVERAEHLVVFNVKGAGGLEVTLEGKRCRGLDVEFLGGADLAELLVVLLGRDPGRPPRSAAVVVVGVGVEVLGVVLLGTVVEELRHVGGGGGLWWSWLG